MTCFFPPTVMTSQVQKANRLTESLARANFHFTWPVAASRATTKGSLAPSQLKMRNPSTSTGEPPFPCTGG
jgi:hypothetical protein